MKQGAVALVTVCHGPLRWGQKSSLSSFRITLVERYQDNFLVCYLYSPIRVFLSSPSALATLPPSPPPPNPPNRPPTTTFLDRSQLKGLMAFWRNITGYNKTYYQNEFISQLPHRCSPPSAGRKSICMMPVTGKRHLCVEILCLSRGIYKCQSRAEIAVSGGKRNGSCTDSILPSCGARWHIESLNCKLAPQFKSSLKEKFTLPLRRCKRVVSTTGLLYTVTA